MMISKNWNVERRGGNSKYPWTIKRRDKATVFGITDKIYTSEAAAFEYLVDYLDGRITKLTDENKTQVQENQKLGSEIKALKEQLMREETKIKTIREAATILGLEFQKPNTVPDIMPPVSIAPAGPVASI